MWLSLTLTPDVYNNTIITRQPWFIIHQWKIDPVLQMWWSLHCKRGEPSIYLRPDTRIRWLPNWVSTGPWITPMSSPNATASNSGTISPRPKVPNDPPLLLLGHVDLRDATWENCEWTRDSAYYCKVGRAVSLEYYLHAIHSARTHTQCGYS